MRPICPIFTRISAVPTLGSATVGIGLISELVNSRDPRRGSKECCTMILGAFNSVNIRATGKLIYTLRNSIL